MKTHLSLDSIRNPPSFSAKQWPTNVERAWVEYVHVRYGSSPLSGVQHDEFDETEKEEE